MSKYRKPFIVSVIVIGIILFLFQEYINYGVQTCSYKTSYSINGVEIDSGEWKDCYTDEVIK